MAEIDVKRVSDSDDPLVYEVIVREGGTKTTHRVNVSSSEYQDLTGGSVPPEKLVECSFEFLLEREPKESIIKTFDLSIISRYFPEYEIRIKDYF